MGEILLQLIVVRHGETDWNRFERLQGQQDIPLNEQGIKQVVLLSKKWKEENIELKAIYTSDLLRAKLTAEIIGESLQVPIYIHQGLRERYFGLVEGKTIAEIQRVEPDFSTLRSEQYPHLLIESVAETKLRIVKTIEEIRTKHLGEKIAVISHGGTITAFLRHILNEESFLNLSRLNNTGVTFLRWESNKWRLERYNDISHLENEKYSN